MYRPCIGTGTPVRIYFWRVKTAKANWVRTRFRATEEHIRREHPEAMRVESDYIEVSDHPAQMFGAISFGNVRDARNANSSPEQRSTIDHAASSYCAVDARLST